MTEQVLIFIRHYLPGYKFGGSLRSMANLVEAFADRCRFRIVTLDRDLHDSAPYPGITPDTWQPVGAAQVMYLPRRPGLGRVRALLDETPHDMIYLQSAFDPAFTTVPLIANRLRGREAAPVLLAPRGEFSPGALALKAPKKRLFIAAARATGLWSNLTWQATADIERTDIETQAGPQARILQATELPTVPAEPPARPAPSEVLRAAFLSRISAKKNLAGALDILARVSVPVRFTIYGPKEDAAYWADCQTRIKAMPAHIEVVYGGSVPPPEVRGRLSEHDFFLFPTFGENFGHAIIDALSAGLPLLITDRTPWRGLAERNVGADLPLEDQAAFVAWINRFATLPQAQRDAMRDAAFAMALSLAEPLSIMDANHEMLRTTIRRGGR